MTDATLTTVTCNIGGSIKGGTNEIAPYVQFWFISMQISGKFGNNIRLRRVAPLVWKILDPPLYSIFI